MKTIQTNVIALAILLASCGQSTTTSVDQNALGEPIETVYTYMETSSEVPTARLLISGMSCVQMCGSRVNAAVANLDGIESTDLSFNADVDVDTLTVSFDPSLVNEKDMVNAIHEIQGTGYRVKEVLLTKELKTSILLEKRNHREKTDSEPKVTAERLSIPNIFDALKRVSAI